MTNYNKMSKRNYKKAEEIIKPVEQPVEEVVETVEAEQPTIEPAESYFKPAEPVKGLVSNCQQLYVRSEASADSEPLGIIKSSSKVEIFEDESTEEFYKVCTATGLEGFCMKQFIEIL